VTEFEPGFKASEPELAEAPSPVTEPDDADPGQARMDAVTYQPAEFSRLPGVNVSGSVPHRLPGQPA
jgi:hypothetical protein